MLSKDQRLPRLHFYHILKNGKKYSAQCMYARVALLPQENRESPTRFSFVVSKKNAKTAVSRHSLKRRGYEAVAECVEYIKPGYGVIFYFIKPVENLAFKQITQDIKSILLQSGLYKNKL